MARAVPGLDERKCNAARKHTAARPRRRQTKVRAFQRCSRSPGTRTTRPGQDQEASTATLPHIGNSTMKGPLRDGRGAMDRGSASGRVITVTGVSSDTGSGDRAGANQAVIDTPSPARRRSLVSWETGRQLGQTARTRCRPYAARLPDGGSIALNTSARTGSPARCWAGPVGTRPPAASPPSVRGCSTSIS
jgi:hypothetical protein